MINTYAIVRLKDMMTPGLQAGYINDTMLDPHAANNNLPGQQLSIAGGVLAPLARSIITNYQGRAKDPPVFVPSDCRSGASLLRAHAGQRQRALQPLGPSAGQE